LNPNNVLIRAENLKKYFAPRQGRLKRTQATFSQWKEAKKRKETKKPFKTLWELNSEPVRAVDGVSLSIAQGEIVGLVGESGSGKTTLGRLLARLTPPTAGRIMFNGEDITTLSRAEMRKYRISGIRMMFQRPEAVLNPLLTVRQILTEAIDTHPDDTHPDSTVPPDREAKLRQLREMVNLPENVLQQYPADLSSGLQRRVSIARTLVGTPKLIIADEPVADLDVSIQAQIINLMKEINEKQEQRVAYLLISHNLKVVQYLSSRILVMYHGRIVEEGKVDEISLQNARHPYTIDLLKSADYNLDLMQPVKSTARQNGQQRGCPFRFDGCPIYEAKTDLRSCCEGDSLPELDGSETHEVACHDV